MDEEDTSNFLSENKHSTSIARKYEHSVITPSFHFAKKNPNINKCILSFQIHKTSVFQ